jgi:lipid-binding SYLF domain-containing protein
LFFILGITITEEGIMTKLFNRTVFFLLSMILVLSAWATAGAQTSRERSTKKARAAADQSAKAARVFEQIMSTREKSIPGDLLDRAEAVAVFPGVLKGGFIVGARGGSGVISRRVSGGWSAPAFFDLGGGSIGLQIGAASTDYILLFMNEHAVESLLNDKFEIGGEGSAAAGPVGRSASASTDAKFNAQILSYSRSKGAFAGLELKGVVIKPDNEDNLQVYGMTARDILTGANKIAMDKMPEGVRVFPQMLARYSRRR